jgi:hypothetical protein
MSIAVALFSFLRHISRLSPKSFIRLLPRNCCLRQRPHAIFAFRALLTSILPLSSFPGSRCNVVFSLSCHFCTAGRPYSGGGQLLARPTIFLKSSLYCHATLARRDTFLHAAANFLPDPQSPRVSSFCSLSHPAGSFRSLCRFFRL